MGALAICALGRPVGVRATLPRPALFNRVPVVVRGVVRGAHLGLVAAQWGAMWPGGRVCELIWFGQVGKLIWPWFLPVARRVLHCAAKYE